MKIVLRAFGNKLNGMMEVPENTTPRFRLALQQPIQAFNQGMFREGTQMMDKPLNTICEFEFTGSVFSQEGHPWDGAREYQLIDITKQ